MRAEATDLITTSGVVTGVCAKTPEGELAINADLVIGCDGRHSTVRERAGLIVEDIGAPIDVLWFRISRRESDGDEVFGHLEAGQMMVMLYRGDYWQCAYVIPKGGIDKVKNEGVAAFRARVLSLSPFLHDRIDEIGSFDDVKLLTVTIDRLREWHAPGLLCIGDAAHAMSPVGGVGINLAIQDAVAAANILAEPLRSGAVTSGTGDDFDFFYFAGPSDFARALGLTGEGDMERIDALFDQRYAADVKLRDAVAQGKVSKATFRNYYGLKASITFSYGSHDEWNILRLINVKRLGGTQFGVANQIASFYDGRPTPPSAAEQPVSNGYMGRCNF
jgi:2-polyprenyl-6-methoxyphenol hydroxylase-like FAD-dependent oxidoreductase